jgi:hypothetical protein
MPREPVCPASRVLTMAGERSAARRRDVMPLRHSSAQRILINRYSLMFGIVPATRN